MQEYAGGAEADTAGPDDPQHEYRHAGAGVEFHMMEPDHVQGMHDCRTSCATGNVFNFIF